MFKEIKAVFKVSEDTSFIKGEWKEDRSHFLFEVKRMLSGAFAYGDRSCHSVVITNVPNALPYHFDTRYDGISTEKEAWIKFWKDWIEDRFGLKVELSEYNENEVETIE